MNAPVRVLQGIAGEGAQLRFPHLPGRRVKHRMNGVWLPSGSRPPGTDGAMFIFDEEPGFLDFVPYSGYIF